MKRERVRRFVKFLPLFVVGATLFVALFSYVVMRLWNWLMPELFGWHQIDLWQALGILVLSKILFGGFSGGSGRSGYSRYRRMRRWEEMTPEERERFRAGIREGCGAVEPPPGEPTA